MACGQAEERVLLTGLHAVADIYCQSCKTPLGWKYVSIFTQRMHGENKEVEFGKSSGLLGNPVIQAIEARKGC